MPRLITLFLFALFLLAFSYAGPSADDYVSYIKADNTKCGHAKAGRVARLINGDSSQRVRVTVETRKMATGYPDYPKVSEDVYVLAAGGSQALGCTRGKYRPYPTIEYTILGEEKL